MSRAVAANDCPAQEKKNVIGQKFVASADHLKSKKKKTDTRKSTPVLKLLACTVSVLNETEYESYSC